MLDLDERKMARELTRKIRRTLKVDFHPGQHVGTPDMLLVGICEDAFYDLLALAREQRAEIERLRAALKPFARADCAVGEEPGPFRFETGTGFVLIQRKDLRRASEALNDQFRGEEG